MSETTLSPTAANTQDFSGSDDEILDGFADPIQDGADTHDDGVPLGLGGEKGKHTEPASATLEADILNGTLPGTTPDDSAPSEPVQDAGDDSTESDALPDTSQQEPKSSPEFPPQLLLAAGYADADAARKDGFSDPDALFAAVNWQSKRLSPKPASTEGLYDKKPRTPADQSSENEDTPDEGGFEIPDEAMEFLEDDVANLLRDMNKHYRDELKSTRKDYGEKIERLREERDSRQKEDESIRFDEMVQSLQGWEGTFGEGSGAELSQKGQYDADALARFNHRDMLFGTVQDIRDLNQKQGNASMPLEQEVQLALMQRYPDKYRTMLSKTAKRIPSGANASRPTQRRTPPKTANQALLDSVDGMLRKKHGIALTRNAADDEFDGEI